MPVFRFLILLGCALAVLAGLAGMGLPEHGVVLALTGAIAAGIALVATLLDGRQATPEPAFDAAPEPVTPVTAPAVAPEQDLLAEIERHKALEQQLLVAKQEAEAATMAKGEFLATMSHEIRTPLNGIIPLLDLVLGTDLAPDQREYLGTAFGSARELLRIVDDILDYSKLDAQKLQLENVGINLRELTSNVTRLMEKSAEAKGLRLEVVIDPTVRLAVRGDPVRLRQVLTNLISNAIKFTERGSITLQISRIGETRTRNQLRFEVRDTGIGIAPEAAAHLFQAFVQADTSTTRTFGGTGLGLAICKRIVSLMDGRIGVDSTPGKGSTFWFEIPLDKALGDIEGRSPVASSELRALLVTANGQQQRRFSAALRNWGMNFVHVSNTQEALARLRAQKRPGQRDFDLILVDAASIPTTLVALHRTLMRETRAEDSLRVYLQGEDVLPAELESAAGFQILRRDSADSELRSRLMTLLDTPAEARPTSGATRAPESAPPPEATPAPRPAPAARVHPAKPAAAPRPVTPAQPLAPVIPLAVPAAAVSALVEATVPPPTAPVATPAASGSTVAAGAQSGPVLLVEDNPVNRQVAQRLLSLAGITFDSAENGKEALDKMNAGDYAVVLMDCQMPIMDGYTSTRRRRQHEAENGLARTPIVAMTANAMLGDREKCLESGMDDYMSKPLNRTLLESTLRTWMATRPTTPPAPAPIAVAAPARPAPPSPPTAPVAAPVASAPAAPGVGTGHPLDLNVLRELREIMGSEFISLVQVFLEDAPHALERIRKFAAEQNLAAIAAPAHTLKSTSANLGALVLSAQAKAMELDSRQNTLRAASARAAALSAEFERVAAALRREIG